MRKQILSILVALTTAGQGLAASLEDIKHIIIIQQENRSFDHYFSDLAKPEFYGDEVDVFDRTQPIATGLRTLPELVPYHFLPESRYNPPHGWVSMWRYYNGGLMNRWKPKAMGYYTSEDIPYYHQLANEYAISDRYFSSLLGPTQPNRAFMLAGTSFGLVGNFGYRTLLRLGIQPRLVLDALNENGHTWAYYTDGTPFLPRMFGPNYPVKKLTALTEALQTDTLPEVVFIDASLNKTMEHPGSGGLAGIQLGSQWVRDRIEAIQNSPVWSKCVIFLTYDENGGFYDHVVPPEAVPPDDVLPRGTGPMAYYRRYNWGFNRYGFRVPFLAVSPFVKKHYVSHEVADHTSVLKFILTRFGLPPLGNRDAVAHDLMDLFDFDVLPEPAGNLENLAVSTAP